MMERPGQVPFKYDLLFPWAVITPSIPGISYNPETYNPTETEGPSILSKRTSA